MADTAILRAKQLASLIIEGANLLADIYGHSFPNVDEWPYVALPDFTEAASRIGLMARPTHEGRLTPHHSFAFNPFVQPNQVEAFESYAQAVYQQEGYPASAGVCPDPDIGFGIFGQYHSSNRTRYKAGTAGKRQ
jgi:hypothetical protein